MKIPFNSSELSDKEKSKLFRDELQKFNSMHGKENLKIPQMGGRELDLYKLFKEVVSRGGSNYVLENKLWKDVVNSLDVPASCTSASFLLRNHYNKCLLAYEQHYMKNQGTLSSSQVSQKNLYNSYQDLPQGTHLQPSNGLEQKFLGKKISKPDGDYGVIFRVARANQTLNKENKDKNYSKRLRLLNAIPDLKRVVLAFESHITSEIIWSINILLLFSSNQNNTLILENQPYLIESLTNYMYYCMNNITEFSHLFSSSLNNQEKNLKSQNFRNPTNTSANPSYISGGAQSAKQVGNKSSFNFLNEINLNSTINLVNLSKKDKQLELKERVKLDNKVHNSLDEVMEFELVEHLISLLQILRNLSLIRPNEPTIMKSPKLMNIIYGLFVNSNTLEIKVNCLDIITNLAKHIILKDLKNGQVVLQQTFYLVKSPLREVSEQALECMRKLTFPVGNEEFFEKLEDDFFEEMVNLLLSYRSETRESVLEILYCVSDQLSCKSKLGKQLHCIERLIGLLCSNSSDNRIAKFAACILSNLATIPANQKIIMPFEEQLFLAACVDETLTKTLMGIISN